MSPLTVFSVRDLPDLLPFMFLRCLPQCLLAALLICTPVATLPKGHQHSMAVPPLGSTASRDMDGNNAMDGDIEDNGNIARSFFLFPIRVSLA